jgi:hypothetical protein
MRAPACALAILLAAPAAAQVCGGQVEMLHCPVKGGRELTLCLGDGQATYRFGPRGAPDLSLTRRLEEIEATPWQGVGRSIFEDVTLRNDGVSYTVWTALDRQVEDNAFSGGVIVTRDGMELASLDCLPGQAEGTVFAVSDAFEEAGFCWQRKDQRWSRDCAE